MEKKSDLVIKSISITKVGRTVNINLSHVDQMEAIGLLELAKLQLLTRSPSPVSKSPVKPFPKKVS